MTQQGKAYLYAITAILFWSTVASAFKISLRYADFIELLFYSSVTSFLFLLFLVWRRGQLPAIRIWGKREFLNSAFLGLLNPFLYYLVLFKAYSLLPAQEAQPLNYTWPIVLVLLSAVFLQHRVTVWMVASMAVSFAGVLIISTRGQIDSLTFTNVPGVLLATGSSIIWATYWIMNVRSKRDQVSKLFLNFLFGTVYVTTAYLLFAEKNLPHPVALAGGVYSGLFEMGLTFVFWLRALKLSRSTALVTNLVFLAPFLSLIVIHFLVGEKIYLSTIGGLILIVGGILLQQKASAKAIENAL